jgi:hypothetical protein
MRRGCTCPLRDCLFFSSIPVADIDLRLMVQSKGKSDIQHRYPDNQHARSLSMPATTQQVLSLSGLIAISVAAGASACVVEDTTVEGVIASSEQALQAGNGLHLNNGLLLKNGLYLDDGTPLLNGLAVGFGLSTSSGLASEAGLSSSAGFMTSPAGRKLVQYMVECALPLGHSITKTGPGQTTYTFEGRVGLAPGWERGACGHDCQQWVSACLLARTNALGETVAIEMVASHPAIGDTRTQPGTYIHEEAGFYGNLFANPPRAYTCQGRQVVEASHHGRVCGLTPWESCGFQNQVGACYDTNSCSAESGDAYVDCRDGAGTSYRTITTFTAPM